MKKKHAILCSTQHIELTPGYAILVESKTITNICGRCLPFGPAKWWRSYRFVSPFVVPAILTGKTQPDLLSPKKLKQKDRQRDCRTVRREKINKEKADTIRITVASVKSLRELKTHYSRLWPGVQLQRVVRYYLSNLKKSNGNYHFLNLTWKLQLSQFSNWNNFIQKRYVNILMFVLGATAQTWYVSSVTLENLLGRFFGSLLGGQATAQNAFSFGRIGVKTWNPPFNLSSVDGTIFVLPASRLKFN